MTIPPPNPNKIDIQLEKDELTLTPGQASPVRVTLSNVGTLVDHLTVTVEGVQQTWIHGSPPSVQLNPGDRAPVALNVSATYVDSAGVAVTYWGLYAFNVTGSNLYTTALDPRLPTVPPTPVDALPITILLETAPPGSPR